VVVALTFHYFSEDQKKKFKCANISLFWYIREKTEKAFKENKRGIMFQHLRIISNK